MVVFLLFPKVRAGVSFKGRLSSPVCHDEDLADAEEEELHEPGEEVAEPGDGVLLGRVGPPAVSSPGEAPPVKLEQLGDDDDEEEELYEVGDEAGRRHDLVERGLELVQLRPETHCYVTSPKIFQFEFCTPGPCPLSSFVWF